MGLTHVGYMQAYFMNVLELHSVLCYAQHCCGLPLGCASNRVRITQLFHKYCTCILLITGGL